MASLGKKLYWTDIDRGRLYRFDPTDYSHELEYEDRPVGGFTLQADGKLLLFRDRGNVVTWSNGCDYCCRQDNGITPVKLIVLSCYVN